MIKVSLMGDIGMRDQEALRTERQALDIAGEILPLLTGTDLRIANWENPTTLVKTPIDKAGPALHSTVDNLCFLTACGIKLAVLANNHTGDQGPDGVMETIAHLNGRGIACVGAGHNDRAALTPYYFEKDGEKLAVCAVCEHEFGYAAPNRPETAAYDSRTLRAIIADMKRNARYALVVFHGGNEYCPFPSPRMKARCRDFAEAGADAVIVMHVHCMQGYEIWRGVPIVYSTGNFFFKQNNPTFRTVGWHYGYIPILTFSKGKPASLEIIPYQYDHACTRIKPFTGERRTEIDRFIDRLNKAVSDEDWHRKLFDGWCVHVGEMYAPGLQFDERYKSGFKNSRLYGIADTFSCEAHHEMLSRYFRILVEDGPEQARSMLSVIRELSCPPVSLFDGE